MKLIECYIENFGKLSSFSYTFSDGLNVIKEDNGYGKTTLSVFIKSMLFGLDSTKKTKLEENDRKHYTPWQGGKFGGSLTFSVGERVYRAERTFMPKAADDTFTLYDCQSGNISTDYSERLGEELFKIDAAGFERTVFMSEKKLLPKSDTQSISAKLSDLSNVDADLGDLDKSLSVLDERRKYYHKKGGGGKISEIRGRLADLEGDIIDLTRLSDSIPEKNERLLAIGREVKELESRVAEFNTKKVALSYEREYLRKRQTKTDAERKLADSVIFFKNGFPSQADIRRAERAYDEARELSKRIAVYEDKGDKTELYAQKFRESEEMIARAKMLPSEEKKPKKSHPVLYFIAFILGAASIFLGAFWNELSFYVGIPISLVALAIAITDSVRAAKKEEISESTLTLLAYLKENGIEHTDKETILNALYDIRASLKNALKAEEDSRDAIHEAEEREARLKVEYNEFLSKYPTVTADPFIEIREALSTYERLHERVKEINAEIASFVREYGINPEGISEGNADIDENLEYQKANAEERLRRLRGEYSLLERECKATAIEIQKLDELYERRAELQDELNAANEKLNIINLTKEHLIRAKESLTAKYLGKTREAFAEYAKLIADEDPALFTMDTSFSLVRSEGGESKPTEAYSLGTREIFALAVRLALIDSLYEKEKPFIILDDPYAHFDDKKLALAMKAMKQIAESRQIIYFTCSKARAI